MAIPLFLDFDYTLFETAGLTREIRALFARHGVSDRQFQQSNEELKPAGYDPLLQTHYFWSTEPPGFAEELAEVLAATAPKLVYPDAQAFLAQLDRSAYSPAILTLGNDRFQRAKIAAAGLDRLIPAVYTCLEEKWLTVTQHVDQNQPFLLVEDRSDTIVMLARNHPHSYGIIVNRHGKERPAAYPYFQVVERLDKLTRPLPRRFPPLYTP